jgi:hypothetical protein
MLAALRHKDTIAYRCARGRTCTGRLPEATRGTMRGLVFIPDLAEEVYAVRACKERRSDRVNGSIAPALYLRGLISVEILRESR